MFCNKINVNILTAHLLAAGIEDAVVCPGSRNAVIVHNLHECATRATAGDGPTMRLHPVTDERSAAFVAIGLWLATRKPIVVCVTSGSALLNLLPGVAEAYYRHFPLILISADRPAEWIGQLDGQTLPQPDALRPYAKCWNVADDATETEIHSLCYEALSATKDNGGTPVHINVPLHEPLFGFTTTELPETPAETRKYVETRKYAETAYEDAVASVSFTPELSDKILNARHPAVIIGQWEEAPIPAIAALQRLGWTIFAENISNHGIFCDTLPEEGIDLLVHIGGALVEKRLKLQLRTLPELTVVRIDETDECPKTFGHVEHKVKAHPAEALARMVSLIAPISRRETTACETSVCKKSSPEKFSSPLAAFFVGNSTAVRWANQHLRLPVPTYCNRGVNGIEGSLSVAAGFSLAASSSEGANSEGAKTLCLIGDLSFFYDANALWNQELDGNLRILLINNNKGGIFYRLPHLDESPALDDYIAARHESNARGIAQSYRCTYLSARTNNLENDIDALLDRLLHEPAERPVILEVNID